MKFTAASTLALASYSFAATTFNLVSIHSGSILQYSSIEVSDGKLVIGTGSDFLGTLEDDGSVSSGSGYLSISSDGSLIISSTKETGFSVDTNLLYNGKGEAVACPSDGNTYSVVWNGDCDNSIGIALYVVESSGSSSKSSTASSEPAVTSSTSWESAVASAAVSSSVLASTVSGSAVTLTTTDCPVASSSAAASSSTSGNSSQPAIQTGNDASNVHIGYSMVGVAAGALAFILA